MGYSGKLKGIASESGIQVTDLSALLQGQPERPAGLVETAFDEPARRCRPLLDHGWEMGVDVACKIHPGEDLREGISLEVFPDRVGGHRRANTLYDRSHHVLQHLDDLSQIDIFYDRLRIFHDKDVELIPTGRQGENGSFQS